MAIEVWQRLGPKITKGGKYPRSTLLFSARGSNDEAAVDAELEANIPSTHGGLLLQEYTLNQIGEELWESEALYGVEQKQEQTPKETGDSSFAFEIGLESAHITQSKETVQRKGDPDDDHAPDLKGAIGETANGIAGCDILIPTYHFSETHYVPVASVTQGYKDAIYAVAAAPVNNGAFRGRAAGEVLFMGASGSQRGQEDWEITFRFAASPNYTGLTVAGISGINKKGWEYVWVKYAEDTDPLAKRVKLVPRAVYVERVYDTSDFSTLGLG